jgi:hypothetical protein
MSGLGPRGTSATPVAILGGATHAISFTGTSARNTTAFNARTRVLSAMVADQNCYIEAGDSTVVATTSSTYLASGAVYSFGIDSNITHVAVIRAGTDGTLRFFESKS